MPLLIDPADIEKLKRSADLAGIVRAHGVTLKKSGKQLVGKCPFHSPDKTPSFFVDPALGKWKCFGACAAKGDESSGGDVFRFLMLADNISFVEAVEKAGVKIERGSLPTPAEKTRSNGNGDLALLARVVDFYHRSLLATPAALEYLAQRGITNVELLKAYRIGYADGSLVAKATGSLRDVLLRLGVFVNAQRELLHGCIVFPLLDAAGVVVNLYGRAIDRDQHLYLPGKQRGLFNAETLRGAAEVILAESVIDAMSAIEANVMNVIPMYGAGGFTPEHETFLTEIKPKRVALALDNDDAGRAATAKLAEVLAPDFDVRVIDLARKDLNEVLVLDGVDALRSALAETEARIDSPTSPETEAAKKESLSLTIDKNELLFTSATRVYTVRGIETKRGASLRVGLKLAVGEKRVIDTVDLVSARSRNGFLSRAVEAQLGDRVEIERDLLILLEAIEKLQREKDAPPPPPKLEMSDEERREAMTLFLRPDLLDLVVADMEALGYVGEATNKQLGYLVAVSRMLEAPLSMVIMSQSGSGKSALADVLELLIPAEGVFVFSRLSAQALYWMERDALRHKFIIIEERAGSADADYSIRSLQSKKRLILAVPIKDPSSGRIKTMIFEVLGPAAFLETTTETRIHPENSTRCFEMYCDESAAQTRRIHDAQRRSKTLASRIAAGEREAIIRRHQNGQRLLEQVGVVIPFVELIEFPHQWLRTRRDNPRFLNLIEAITFVYQHQREHKRDQDGRVYIEATIEDYTRAYTLAAEVLGQTLSDIKRPAQELYVAVRELTAKKGDVTRREIREATGLPDHRVSALLNELVQLEYLEVVVGSQGRTFRYRLTATKADMPHTLAGLTTPDELRAKLGAAAPTSKLRKVV